jgi:hypothetical protein
MMFPGMPAGEVVPRDRRAVQNAGENDGPRKKREVTKVERDLRARSRRGEVWPRKSTGRHKKNGMGRRVGVGGMHGASKSLGIGIGSRDGLAILVAGGGTLVVICSWMPSAAA